MSTKKKTQKTEPFTVLRTMEGKLISKDTKNKVMEAGLKGKINSYPKEYIKSLRQEMGVRRRDFIFKVKEQKKLIERICQEYEDMFLSYRGRYTCLTEKILSSTLAIFPCKKMPTNLSR